MMNEENKKLIREAVKEAGDFLQGKLPDLPEHAKRNPYAHLWRSIKQKMGQTYKECYDTDLPIILAIIAWHRANPS